MDFYVLSLLLKILIKKKKEVLSFLLLSINDVEIVFIL